MKKKLTIVLVLTLLVGLLTGCVAMSDEKLTINAVYAKSEADAGNDPVAKPASDDMAALRKDFLLAGKDFYCDGGNYSEKLAEAAKDSVDIVVCVGEELKDLTGVAAANPTVKWIWVGGDETLSSDSIFVISAEDAASNALLNKLTEFIEHDTAKDYSWSSAKPADTSAVTTEAASTEETAG